MTLRRVPAILDAHGRLVRRKTLYGTTIAGRNDRKRYRLTGVVFFAREIPDVRVRRATNASFHSSDFDRDPIARVNRRQRPKPTRCARVRIMRSRTIRRKIRCSVGEVVFRGQSETNKYRAIVVLETENGRYEYKKKLSLRKQ